MRHFFAVVLALKHIFPFFFRFDLKSPAPDSKSGQLYGRETKQDKKVTV